MHPSTEPESHSRARASDALRPSRRAVTSGPDGSRLPLNATSDADASRLAMSAATSDTDASRLAMSGATSAPDASRLALSTRTSDADASRIALGAAICDAARELGFDDVGIAPIRESDHAEFYRAWIDAGRHATMSYLAREDAVRARLQPTEAWPGLRSAIVVALHYDASDESAEGDRGIIARYARGRDYHKVIKAQLLRLLDRIENLVGRDLPIARAYVDTGPVLERELAQRAGLGWFGRNTMMIHPRRGSWFFLATLLTELDLSADRTMVADHCGTCRRCVESCPTGALLGRDRDGAPVMDASRCISYLTIEHRGAIPPELRRLMGNRIFGCDICNEVCPWNGPKFTQITREPDFTPRAAMQAPALPALMAMDEHAFDLFSRGSPVRRAKRSGFLRNVAVALGNTESPDAIPALTHALRDVEPLVRGHAAWALGRVGTREALDAVRDALTLECNIEARAEMMSALGLASLHPSATASSHDDSAERDMHVAPTAEQVPNIPPENASVISRTENGGTA